MRTETSSIATGSKGSYRVERVDEGWKLTLNGERLGTLAKRDGAERAAERAEGSEDVPVHRPGVQPAPSPSKPAVAAECPFTTVERDRDELARAHKLGVIKNARDVYNLLHDELSKSSQEIFLVLPLDVQQQLVSRPVEVARGQRDRVTVDIADILRPVITTNAAGFVLVHCHPSGNAHPSQADVSLTRDVRKSAKSIVPNSALIDHVIIGSTGKKGQFYSIEEGKLYRV